MPAPRPRRTLVAVAAIVLVGLVVVVGAQDDRTDLERARDLTEDAGRFETGVEAGATLARVAEHLNDAVVACDVGTDGARCSALSAASGYAQVLAAVVLTCTAPGRFEARTRMASLLEQVAGLAPGGDVPDPPALPAC